MNSTTSLPPTGEGVVIDIGTGDGLFVYQSARENPRKFYIGVDANARPLEKISEKIHRKPAKGGLPNVLFVQTAVEDLPSELDGVADEVHVHFPWGSLLRAVSTADRMVAPRYRTAVFELIERRILEARDCADMQCTWAKRLSRDPDRRICYIVARAF